MTKERQWEFDVERFELLNKLYSVAVSSFAAEYAWAKLQELVAKYPRHLKMPSPRHSLKG